MVVIKDFEMPSCCGECQMASCKGLSGQFYCDITTYDVDMDDTERDANCPLVEAISKDQYEERLKADMIAMLTELQLEIEELRLDRPLMSRGYECYGFEDKTPTEIQQECSDIIQQKINALKEKEDE